MAENLLIRFQSDAESVEWMMTGDTGAPVGQVNTGSVDSLAEIRCQGKIVVLVPATDVLLTSVNIPIRNAARLKQALPFAMEEQLADNLSELHFAMGVRSGNSEVPVAVIRRNLLEEYLEKLNAVGIEPQVILGEQATIPGSPTATTLLIDDQKCYFRYPNESPFAMEGDGIEDFLTLGDPGARDPEGGAHLTVYLEPDRQEGLADGLERLRDDLASLDIRLMPDGPLPLLIPGAFDRKAINLLQGEYAPSTGMEKTWKPWRAAAILIAVLFVLSIARQASTLYQLNAQNKQLDTTIESIFRDAIPDVQRIVNPRAQMESRLAAARAATGAVDAPFLTAVDVISRAVSAAPNSQIEALSFRNGILELKISVPGVDTLDRIQKQVIADGQLEASILSATPRSDGVEGRLRVSVAGA
ncbi:MAG: type II secretion system protein GspL [Gammaproteobacteria bacterium]